MSFIVSNVLKLIVSLLILLLFGCGQGRNFDGAPIPFEAPNVANSDSLTLYPESFFGFRPDQNGYFFNISLRSSNGLHRSTLSVYVNNETQRISLNNISLGVLSCKLKDIINTCEVNWLSQIKYFGFDLNRFRFKFETKPIFAVEKMGSLEGKDLSVCRLDPNQSFIAGERLKISLLDTESLLTKDLFYYNFGTQNLGSFVNLSGPYLNYYSYDFEPHFGTSPYFYDAFRVQNFQKLYLYWISARSLDELNTTSVHFCFYDTH